MTNYHQHYDATTGNDGDVALRRVNVGPQIYSNALASLWQNAYILYDQSYPDSKDIAWWEKIQRDPVCAQAIDMRRTAVSGTEWSLEPTTDDEIDADAASILEQVLAAMPGFDRGRYNLTDAVIRGSAYAMLYGDYRTWSPVVGRGKDARKLPPKRWWLPDGMQDIDRRRMELRMCAEDNQIRWHLANVSSGFAEWEPVPDDASHFVRWVYKDSEERLGYGRGVGEALYFPWAYKVSALQQVLRGIERWAGGVTVAKLDQDRQGSIDRDNDTIQQQVEENLARQLSSGVVTVAVGEEVDFRNGPTAGLGEALRVIEYADNKIISLCMGSNMPFGGGGEAGSYARAETEADASAEYLKYDIRVFEEVLTESVVRTVYNLNRHHLRDMGLGGARCPRLKLGKQAQMDPQTAIAVIQGAQAVGLKISTEEAYEKTGFARPNDTDELLEPPQQGGMADMFGGMGGGMPEGGDDAPLPDDADALADWLMEGEEGAEYNADGGVVRYALSYDGGKTFGELSPDQRSALRSWWAGGKEGAAPVSIDDGEGEDFGSAPAAERKDKLTASVQQIADDSGADLWAVDTLLRRAQESYDEAKVEFDRVEALKPLDALREKALDDPESHLSDYMAALEAASGDYRAESALEELEWAVENEDEDEIRAALEREVAHEESHHEAQMELAEAEGRLERQKQKKLTIQAAIATAVQLGFEEFDVGVSAKSDSTYLDVTDPETGEQLKIRFSDHRLPPRYETKAAELDFGDESGEWPSPEDVMWKLREALPAAAERLREEMGYSADADVVRYAIGLAPTKSDDERTLKGRSSFAGTQAGGGDDWRSAAAEKGWDTRRNGQAAQPEQPTLQQPQAQTPSQPQAQPRTKPQPQIASSAQDVASQMQAHIAKDVAAVRQGKAPSTDSLVNPEDAEDVAQGVQAFTSAVESGDYDKAAKLADTLETQLNDAGFVRDFLDEYRSQSEQRSEQAEPIKAPSEAAAKAIAPLEKAAPQVAQAVTEAAPKLADAGRNVAEAMKSNEPSKIETATTELLDMAIGSIPAMQGAIEKLAERGLDAIEAGKRLWQKLEAWWDKPDEIRTTTRPARAGEYRAIDGDAVLYALSYEGGKRFGELSGDQQKALRSWRSGGKKGAPPVKIDDERVAQNRNWGEPDDIGAYRSERGLKGAITRARNAGVSDMRIAGRLMHKKGVSKEAVKRLMKLGAKGEGKSGDGVPKGVSKVRVRHAKLTSKGAPLLNADGSPRLFDAEVYKGDGFMAATPEEARSMARSREAYKAADVEKYRKRIVYVQKGTTNQVVEECARGFAMIEAAGFAVPERAKAVICSSPEFDRLLGDRPQRRRAAAGVASMERGVCATFPHVANEQLKWARKVAPDKVRDLYDKTRANAEANKKRRVRSAAGDMALNNDFEEWLEATGAAEGSGFYRGVGGKSVLSTPAYSAGGSGTMVHEIGHVLHGMNLKRISNDGVAAKTARLPLSTREKVSMYATENSKEYVAECFAAIVFGRELTDEQMTAYEALGGPMPNA